MRSTQPSGGHTWTCNRRQSHNSAQQHNPAPHHTLTMQRQLLLACCSACMCLVQSKQHESVLQLLTTCASCASGGRPGQVRSQPSSGPMPTGLMHFQHINGHALWPVPASVTLADGAEPKQSHPYAHVMQCHAVTQSVHGRSCSALRQNPQPKPASQHSINSHTLYKSQLECAIAARSHAGNLTRCFKLQPAPLHPAMPALRSHSGPRANNHGRLPQAPQPINLCNETKHLQAPADTPCAKTQRRAAATATLNPVGGAALLVCREQCWHGSLCGTIWCHTCMCDAVPQLQLLVQQTNEQHLGADAVENPVVFADACSARAPCMMTPSTTPTSGKGGLHLGGECCKDCLAGSAERRGHKQAGNEDHILPSSADRSTTGHHR